MTSFAESKNVIVVSDELPLGLAVNAASILSVTLGHRVDGLVGSDVKDANNIVHPGIICTPLPVLKTDSPDIARIIESALAEEEIFCVAFSSLAQSCKTYDEYIQRMGETPTAAIEAVAVALVGPKKKVNKLIGSLPLLR